MAERWYITTSDEIGRSPARYCTHSRIIDRHPVAWALEHLDETIGIVFAMRVPSDTPTKGGDR